MCKIPFPGKWRLEIIPIIWEKILTIPLCRWTGCLKICGFVTVTIHEGDQLFYAEKPFSD